LFGLIDCFRKISDQRSGMKLTIISYGDGFEELESAVSSDESITVVGETPHGELGEYLKRAKLYVGMGTTVLEAANLGTPSLLAKSYTYDFSTSGLFSENPSALVASESEVVPDAAAAMLEVIDMDQNEYVQLCEKTKEAVDLNYDCEKNVGSLMALFDKQTACTDRMMSLESHLRRLRKRLKTILPRKKP